MNKESTSNRPAPLALCQWSEGLETGKVFKPAFHRHEALTPRPHPPRADGGQYRKHNSKAVVSMGHVASSAAISISFTIRTRRMGSCAVLKRGVFSQPSDSPSARGGWGLEDVGKDKAFRHQRMNHDRTRRRNPSCEICAQRLSASTNESPRQSKHRKRRSRVLNAFRHQRMNHPTARCISGVSVTVLNAFRHQRMNHGRNCGGCGSCHSCSTPFGINE